MRAEEKERKKEKERWRHLWTIMIHVYKYHTKSEGVGGGCEERWLDEESRKAGDGEFDLKKGTRIKVYAYVTWQQPSMDQLPYAC